MTPSQILALAPKEKCVKIAKADGWVKVAISANDQEFGWCKNGITVGILGLPDYRNDLNAMHEAEKAIPITRLDEYWKALACIVTSFTAEEFDQSNEYSCADIACATATQRADAFLLIILSKKS